ncbi:MAG: hypothetical protein ACRCTI_07290 [Beijerinckiaceae bacterium]
MKFVAPLAAALAACASPAFAQEIRLGDLRAHLYLERSGKLSDDLLSQKSLKLTDLPRGEGAFGEPANTLILNVTLLGAPNTQPKHASALVNITTTNRTGQRRTETRPLLGFVFGDDGRLNRPIVLDNITCSKVEIEVKSRGAAKRAELPFTCTEPKTADAGEQAKPPRR